MVLSLVVICLLTVTSSLLVSNKLKYKQDIRRVERVEYHRYDKTL